jgi:hypothetical protein
MPLHDVPVRLAIAQMGMVSPIGAELATSCASARANLSRRSELSYRVVGPDGDPLKATGHQAEYLTKGFRGDARLVRLLAGALDDLVANMARDAWASTIDVFLAIPASFRDDPDQKVDLFSSPWESTQTAPADVVRGRSIVEKALAAARVPSKVGALSVITQGQASVGVALEAVAVGFGKGDQRPALILAVDAPVDPERVAGLDKRGRLAGPNVPAGAAPGELGAAMLVTNYDAAISQRLPAIGQILQPQSLESQPNFSADAPPDGRALASLAASVIQSMPAFGLPSDVWWILDMNGETYRAREWGTAMVHLKHGLPSIDTQNVWLPAANFGDCGAATGLAATALAVRGFARRYAPATGALVLCAADGARRTAFAVAGWA